MKAGGGSRGSPKPAREGPAVDAKPHQRAMRTAGVATRRAPRAAAPDRGTPDQFWRRQRPDGRSIESGRSAMARRGQRIAAAAAIDGLEATNG
jgi:hypothetical protein